MSDLEHAWPFYCEENVWHACAAPARDGVEAYAVFVSNPARRVAMWCQRAASPGEPIVWDYHVVLLERRGEWRIRDVDCRLGDDLPAATWLARSFPSLPPHAGGQEPCFRLVPAATYRDALRSDRSHMRRGDEWQAPPPPWPAISAGSNLMRFVDVETDFLGELLGLAELTERLQS